MKIRPLASALAFLFCCFAFASAPRDAWELPAQKAGAGAFSRYNLGAEIGGDQATVYYVAISVKGKIDLASFAASTGGVPLPILVRQEASAFLAKFPWFKAGLTRDQMEQGAKSGLTIDVQSNKRAFSVAIPAEQFSAMLRDADLRDDFRRDQIAKAEADEAKARADKVAADLHRAILSVADEFDRNAFADYTRKGSGKITGQAFLKTKGGDIKVGAGNTVRLLPATTWVESATLVAGDFGSFLAALTPASRAKVDSIDRECEADASGNFEFTDLPDGEYLLETNITWEIPGVYGSTTTGGRVTRYVAVRDGKPVRVMLTE